MKQKLVIGTRGSKLALWQANHVAARLREHCPEVTIELKHMVTTGDKILDVPLAKIGGKGLFTKELEVSMLQGDIDLAVHSLKDMPTELPSGLILAAVTERVDPGDALISPAYKTLANLPRNARVGTSSLRRKAQLLNARPDLTIVDLRGNLDTRLKKLTTEKLDAILLAVAGLKRLGWDQQITEILPHTVCLPAVGQGALAIEARENDKETLAMLAFLNHEATRQATLAERAFLAEVEGGCQIPIGVYGQFEAKNELTLNAVIMSPDGKEAVRDRIGGNPVEAASLGHTLAVRMLDKGGREILAKLFAD
ncbi:hydroxymethylbilane synthase [Sporomusa acidovorans]|uniref:Porphobilinogen deaminase n=1 Tax=Sporomusa acidovorans (strain ATCC 49682 / DSM 3132 / Mol) TaxID=1123286 RepID=A0ABZ3J997_SPOA4|nr:hydroxymethylbilane synthase [Sporomusa acidovorans]OZC22922.1 porphobilinogen deaminase [Sporomusa acidovorans DSM 3132]SDE95169.1 hydroxymethylbilane synthase [Sporomusa acidovorans]